MGMWQHTSGHTDDILPEILINFISNEHKGVMPYVCESFAELMVEKIAFVWCNMAEVLAVSS